jgi:hypothetical protein
VSDTRPSMPALFKSAGCVLSAPAPRGSHGLHVEDVRQRALALQLAAAEVEALGFQYICTMNSDIVPHEDFRRSSISSRL